MGNHLAAFDTGRWLRISPYLDHALDLPPGELEGWLAALRVSEPDLATDVAAMLEEHRALCRQGFLDTGARVLTGPEALEGMSVGAYTLVKSIGRGGMGSVWLATRNDGRYEGQAAVKLLNADLVGRTGGARFTREGTILARLTHPHIARLIDAGVSATGQPYLVLEHIDGRHIDRHCDWHALGIEARIRLFLDVLAAVAHAHANLIVHRDLKPSNVLVNGDGQVKLLDFGIAKLLETDQPIHEPTLTRDAGAGMTPRYAAPEQVSGGAITTATDVYSLGVILYELLSGHDPIGPGAVHAAEIVKAIVDVEPRKMSDLVDGHPAEQDENTQRAARRGVTPDKLQRVLRGDLDTIVAKALKKKPEERYGSVAELADDLRRYVNNLPINARPDSVAYRAIKFVRRHRRSLALAAAAVLMIAGTIAFYTVKLANERDRAARQAVKTAKVSEFLTEILDGADPFRTPDSQEPTIRHLLDTGAEKISRDLQGAPDVQAEVSTVVGRIYTRLGIYDKALPYLQQAVTLGRQSMGPEHLSIAQALNELGVLQRERGDLAAAQPLLEESLKMRRHLLGPNDKDVAVTAVELARVLRDRGHDDQAEPLVREGLAIRRKIFGNVHRETATSINDLALLLWQRGDLDGAEPLFRESLATNIAVLGAAHPSVGTSKGNLALVLNAKGRSAEAEALYREQIAIMRKALGEKHPSYAQALNNLSRAVLDQGRPAEAKALLDECLSIVEPVFKDENPRLAIYRTNLGRVELALRHPQAAEVVLRRALASRQKIYAAGDWRIAQVKSMLGAALTGEKRYADAEPLLLDAAQHLKPGPGGQTKELADNHTRLAELYIATGRSQK